VLLNKSTGNIAQKADREKKKMFHPDRLGPWSWLERRIVWVALIRHSGYAEASHPAFLNRLDSLGTKAEGIIDVN